MSLNKLNKLKIYKIVEYIKQHLFEFECDEVINNLQGILVHYGLKDDLNEAEQEQLKKDLHCLAEQFEISESLRLFHKSSLEKTYNDSIAIQTDEGGESLSTWVTVPVLRDIGWEEKARRRFD